jgi:tetratricopeptide (TPR) repeat protein
MLLHAAEYFEAAEPCYRNAQSLMPSDPRWPYYLARLYQTTGRAAEAEAAYERTLQLRPDDVPALLRLGRMYLDRGDAGAAAPLFEKARAADSRSVAALAGLGQAALDARQYERAVRFLEEGLAVEPGALSLHAPLAQAYRAMGRTQDAEAHLARWRNTEIPIPDPRAADLEVLLESGLAYELRGGRAMSAAQWDEAADLFRKGIALAPDGSALRRSLHHKLGTALWMGGDEKAAVAAFDDVVRTAPRTGADEPASRAHYSLGIVMASAGRTREALDHLRSAVRYGPDYAEAHLALAEILKGSGQFEAALPHYQAAVRGNSRATQARLGYALSLVGLSRYVEARDSLDESVRAQPDNATLKHALARVLAAAPDARARDGRRALELVEQVAATVKTLEVGETLAMALAETGDYEKAAAVQRDVMDNAKRAGIVGAFSRNLTLYEKGRPCRTPWREGEMSNAQWHISR